MASAQWMTMGLAVTLALGGCGDEPAPAAAAPKALTLLAQGALTTTFAGSPVAIDYTGRPATLAMTHKINKAANGLACVVQLDLSVADKDGACQLDLKWKVGSDGLQLDKARFHAVRLLTPSDKQPCPGWPTEKTAGQIIYEGASSPGSSDAATITMPPLKAPLAGAEKPTLDLDLKMTGKVDMKFGGKKFVLDLATLAFKGTGTSTGRTDVECGTTGPTKGIDQCPKKVAYGNENGQFLRRGVILTRCDDGEPYDLGEMCGASAIWVTDFRGWTDVDDAIDAHRASYDKFKDQGVAAAFIVVEGKAKVVVPKPGGKPDEFEASGPKPTAEECLAIKAKYKIHDDVVMLYDKDAKLLTLETKLSSAKCIPAMVFAKGDGQIVTQLPEADCKAPTGALIDAALTAALEAP